MHVKNRPRFRFRHNSLDRITFFEVLRAGELTAYNLVTNETDKILCLLAIVHCQHRRIGDLAEKLADHCACSRDHSLMLVVLVHLCKQISASTLEVQISQGPFYNEEVFMSMVRAHRASLSEDLQLFLYCSSLLPLPHRPKSQPQLLAPRG